MNGDTSSGDQDEQTAPEQEAPTDQPEAASGSPSDAAMPSPDALFTDAYVTDAPPTPRPWPDEQRRQTIEAFERWLDATVAGEPLPDGLSPEIVAESLAVSDTPPSEEADLYTVFSGLTSLTGEIRLQGRAFKQLTDLLSTVGTLPDRLAALEAAQERAADELVQTSDRLVRLAATSEKSSAGLPDVKDVLSLVFDLHARLERGLESFDDSVAAARRPPTKRGLLSRLLGGKSEMPTEIDTDALRDGYQMTLSRLEGALRQWGIERIGEVGEPFEPGCMQAVDVASVAGIDDGTILDVYRSGYVSHGRVLETAKVKVSKQG